MDLISREWITQAMEHCPWDTEKDRNRAIHYVRDIAPSVDTTTDCKTNLISRRDAIEYFMTNTNWHDEDGYPIEDSSEKRALLEGYFSGVPSAETTGALDEAIHKYVEEGLMELPGRPNNAWTGVDEFPHEVLECGHCGYLRMLETANDTWPNYCENCGADMKGDSE